MATSSSLKTEEEIVPYQFEPRREKRSENTSSGSEDWVTDSESDEDDDQLQGQNVVGAERWCTCGHCQTKYSVSECICCWEIDETKKIYF